MWAQSKTNKKLDLTNLSPTEIILVVNAILAAQSLLKQEGFEVHLKTGRIVPRCFSKEK